MGHDFIVRVHVMFRAPKRDAWYILKGSNCGPKQECILGSAELEACLVGKV